MLPGIVEDTLIEELQAGYDAAKEKVKTLFLSLIGDVIVDTIRQRKMDSLLIRNIGAFTRSDTIMDALTPRVAGCLSLISPMTTHVQRHINKIEE